MIEVDDTILNLCNSSHPTQTIINDLHVPFRD